MGQQRYAEYTIGRSCKQSGCFKENEDKTLRKVDISGRYNEEKNFKNLILTGHIVGKRDRRNERE